MTVSAERPLAGVGVVVIDDGRLLLVKRGGEVGHGLWAVPGGKVRLGETLQEAAAREASEETGLQVDIGSVLWVGESIGEGDPPDHHFVLVDFAAVVVGGALQADDDAADAAFVPLDEVRSLPLTPSMFQLLDDLSIE